MSREAMRERRLDTGKRTDKPCDFAFPILLEVYMHSNTMPVVCPLNQGAVTVPSFHSCSCKKWQRPVLVPNSLHLSSQAALLFLNYEIVNFLARALAAGPEH